MEAPKITKEQIEEAIRAAQMASFNRPDNCYTAPELAELMDMTIEKARRKAELMVELGLAERIEVKTIDKRGNCVKSPAYTLKLPPK